MIGVRGALSPATKRSKSFRARVLPRREDSPLGHCGGEAFGRTKLLFQLPRRSGIERPENSPVDCMDATLDALRALQWFERPENSPVESFQRERVGRPPSMGPVGPWRSGPKGR